MYRNVAAIIVPNPLMLVKNQELCGILITEMRKFNMPATNDNIDAVKTTLLFIYNHHEGWRMRIEGYSAN